MTIEEFFAFICRYPDLLLKSRYTVEDMLIFLNTVNAEDLLMRYKTKDINHREIQVPLFELLLTRFREIYFSGYEEKYAKEYKEDLIRITRAVIRRQPQVLTDIKYPLQAIVKRCEFGAVEIFNVFSSNEDYASQKDDQGFTALHYACDPKKFFSPETVRILLSLSANVNVAGKGGITPLHLALTYQLGGYTGIKSNDAAYKIVQQLIKAKANPSLEFTEEFMSTAFHFACEHCTYDIIKLLLSSSYVNINKRDGRSRTALDIAIKRNEIDIVYLLLRQPGVDWSSVDIEKLKADCDKLKEEKSIAVRKKIISFVKSKKHEQEELSKADSHWIESLKFLYLRAKEEIWQGVSVDGEKIHYLLQAKWALAKSRAASNEKLFDLATTAFTFVISNRDGIIEDYTVEVSSKEYAAVHRSLENDPEFRKKFVVYLQQMFTDVTNDSQSISINKQENFKPKTAKQIAEEAENPKSDFEANFIRSEQAIIYYILKEKAGLQKVLQSLEDSIPADEKLISSDDAKKPLTIKAVIWHIFTEKSMSENCRVVVESAEKKYFYQRLAEEVKSSKCFSLSKSGASFTIVASSNKPFIRNTDQHKEADCRFDHKKFTVHLNKLRPGILFFKDVSNSELSIADFTGNNDEAAKLKAENNRLKGEKRALSEENERLKEQLGDNPEEYLTLNNNNNAVHPPKKQKLY